MLKKTKLINTTGFSLEGESNKFISLEFESAFNPSLNFMRRYVLKHQIDVGENITMDLLRQAVLFDILRNWKEPQGSPIQGPVMDGGGLEFQFPPATIMAHYELSEYYKMLIEKLKSLEFSDNMGTDGIHINIDLVLFGHTVEEQAKNLEKFVYFLYYHRQSPVLNALFKRRAGFEDKSDLNWLLDDKLAIQAPDELLVRLKTQKSYLIDCLRKGVGHFSYILNMSINKDGRPCLEFRWFGSRLNYEFVMQCLEWGFVITDFVSKNPLVKMQNIDLFIEHIFESNVMYLKGAITNL